MSAKPQNMKELCASAEPVYTSQPTVVTDANGTETTKKVVRYDGEATVQLAMYRQLAPSLTALSAAIGNNAAFFGLKPGDDTLMILASYLDRHLKNTQRVPAINVRADGESVRIEMATTTSPLCWEIVSQELWVQCLCAWCADAGLVAVHQAQPQTEGK